MMILILVLAFCALLIIYAAFHKDTPSEKGTQGTGSKGENDIVRCLNRQMDTGLHGLILQNLYIPKGEKETTEIDILFITSKGLFVIESKDYAGYIFGNDQERFWTVSLYAGRDSFGKKYTEKHQFYNPVWQNRMHVKYLSRLFEGYVPIQSLVVFSDRGTFSNLSCYSDDVHIMQLAALKRYFVSVQENWLDQLSEEQMQQIYDQLLPYTHVSEQVKQEHLEHILWVKNNPELCPWCGGKLVKRTARKGPNAGGEFYGCSNYPKCRYTRSL